MKLYLSALCMCCGSADRKSVLQIPDVDAILHTSDFSCIAATPAGQEPAGPPIFGYNSDPAHEDVPFPDYSYWGHEYTRLRGDPAGHCVLPLDTATDFPANACMSSCQKSAMCADCATYMNIAMYQHAEH